MSVRSTPICGPWWNESIYFVESSFVANRKIGAFYRTTDCETDGGDDVWKIGSFFFP